MTGVVVLAAYWPSLGFDLYEDDFYDLRPWPSDHLASAWFGAWTPSGVADYYRPIAVWSFHLLFDVFGWNTRALHVLPLITLTVVSWLVGQFVQRETQSRGLAIAASLLFAIHPATVAAGGPWIVNQYQSLVPATLVIALLLWQSRRTQSWTTWGIVALPIVIGAWSKENGLMTPLMLLAVAWARHVWLGERTRDGRTLAFAAIGVFIALNLWRLAALGWSMPEPGSGFASWKALVGGAVVFLWHPVVGEVTPYSMVFAAASTVLTIAGLWALVKKTPGPAAALVLTGLVILVLASIPSAVVFSRERLVPHGVGVVFMWVGGLAAVRAWLTPVARVGFVTRGAGVVAAVVAIAATVSLTRTALQQFSPCHAYPMETPAVQADFLFHEVPPVPPEVVGWVRTHPRPCEPSMLEPMFRVATTMTWNVSERRFSVDDVVQRWEEPEVTALVTPRAQAVLVEVRHTHATPERPVRIRVSRSGGETPDITLTSPEWQQVDVPLAGDWRSWLRQMYRLDLTVAPGQSSGLDMRPLVVVPKGE